MSGDQQHYPAGERAFDRRAFLGGSLLVLGGSLLGRIPGAGAVPSRDLEGFLELSRIATGVEALPRRLGPEYLKALDAAPQLTVKPSRLLRLAGYANGHGPTSLSGLERAALGTKDGKECLDAIAAAWWSGLVPIAGGGQRVVTFTDALVWHEVHEPTTCQGATGSWAQPGRAVL